MPTRLRLWSILIVLSSLLVAPSTPADEPAAVPTVADQVAKIGAEYDAQMAAASQAMSKAADKPQGMAAYQKLMPDAGAYARRMLDLAEAHRRDPGTRDALLWVVARPGMGGGSYDDLYVSRAAYWLIADHADDPEVARIGLSLSNLMSRARDALLEGVYAGAKGHEAKGLARFALAQYLERKAGFVAAWRKEPGNGMIRYQTYDDHGKLVYKEVEAAAGEMAYRYEMALGDADRMHKEASRLYEEVIGEYADIPYITRVIREQAAKVNARPPAEDDEKQAQLRVAIQKRLDRKETLGQVAEARLDEIYKLAIGQPAPEIEGLDMDGKPLKLSDYRGKVVAVVFWGSWCGPCVREIPHEREIVERLKGRPFALLGVDCDEDEKAGRKMIADEKMTWPQWHDGAPGTGPIDSKYHVRSYPGGVVLDAKGIIRAKGPRGEGLDRIVDQLLKEMEKEEPAK